MIIILEQTKKIEYLKFVIKRIKIIIFMNTHYEVNSECKNIENFKHTILKITIKKQINF